MARQRSAESTWDRREFLVGSLATIAGAWVGGIGVIASAAEADAPQVDAAVDPETASGDRFSLGVQSFTLRRYALEPMLDRLVELGIDRVELIPDLTILFYTLGSHLPITAEPDELARVAEALAARKVRISASGVHSVSNAEDASQLFEFARRARIPLLTISPDDEALAPLDGLCRRHPEIRLGIHNHGPWTRYDTIADVEASLAGRAPNFGACVDTGHFIRSGEDPVEAIRRLGPRVHGVHLKDFEGPGFFASSCLLGEGKLDLPKFFRALHEVGFGAESALSLELESGLEDDLGLLHESIARARIAAKRG